MKTTFTRNTLKHSLFSLLVLGIFVLLATGSLLELYSALDIDIETSHDGSGIYWEKETHHSTNNVITTEGPRDDQGRWNGRVTIEYYDDFSELTYTEEVVMVHGTRNGLSTRTYPDGKVEEDHYLNGVKLNESQSAKGTLAEGSAYSLLETRHPWFLFVMEAHGYDPAYVEGFLDSIDSMLGRAEFDIDDFDDYYDMALDSLSATPYDSILVAMNSLAGSMGIKKVKDDLLRQAVVDRYRTGSTSTFSVLNASYPGYVSEMNNLGVNATDLEAFCAALDDSLSMFGTPDPEDAFFVDTAENYFYAAIFSFADDEELKSAGKFTKTGHRDTRILRQVLRETYSFKSTAGPAATPDEVGALAAANLLFLLLEGDVFREITRDAYLAREEIAVLPLVGTGVITTGSTSAELQGNVADDGGATVIARGIAWAQHFTPTVEDNVEASGTGAGQFTVTLDGLTEGETYYARAYATNGGGTAYGNVVSFVPESTVGTGQPSHLQESLAIYPNPAASAVTVRIDAGAGNAGKILITDLSGRTVWQKELPGGAGSLTEIRADVSELPEGMYHCAVLQDAKIIAGGQLVIAR